ncbi:hypothetical protein F4815DRAFT_464717 [Daldinia loculata]|nr:hypothetical protein F4815DRAFT_464717 [Daldinia loculata]
MDFFRSSRSIRALLACLQTRRHVCVCLIRRLGGTFLSFFFFSPLFCETYSYSYGLSAAAAAAAAGVYSVDRLQDQRQERKRYNTNKTCLLSWRRRMERGKCDVVQRRCSISVEAFRYL